MNRRLARIDQTLVFLLMADAGIVALGLATGVNMWKWIIAYWIILTTKNLLSFICNSKKGAKHEDC